MPQKHPPARTARYFENMGGDPAAFIDDRIGGPADDDAGEPHRAGGVRAASDRDNVGIMGDDADSFERNAQPVGHELGKTRLVSLAARQRADHDVDAAIRVDKNFRPLARHSACCLDIVGNPNSAQAPMPRGPPAALRKSAPICQRKGLVHGLLIGAAIIGQAQWIGVRHRGDRHEIAAP